MRLSSVPHLPVKKLLPQLLHGFVNGFLCQHVGASDGVDIVDDHVALLGEKDAGNDLALGIVVGRTPSINRHGSNHITATNGRVFTEIVTDFRPLTLLFGAVRCLILDFALISACILFHSFSPFIFLNISYSRMSSICSTTPTLAT